MALPELASQAIDRRQAPPGICLDLSPVIHDSPAGFQRLFYNGRPGSFPEGSYLALARFGLEGEPTKRGDQREPDEGWGTSRSSQQRAKASDRRVEFW